MAMPCDVYDIALRLQLLERCIGEIHYCLIGQWLPHYMPEPDPAVFDKAHSPHTDISSNSDTSHTSPSKRRRRRAKLVRERMWTQMKFPRNLEDNVNSCAASTQTSIVDTADFARMPEHAWTPIYEKFRVPTYSGQSLTVQAAHAIKRRIVDDETQRLQDLREEIGQYIRSSDGSDKARKDIAAVTSAMSNAKAVCEHAAQLSVYDFFRECPLMTCKI